MNFGMNHASRCRIDHSTLTCNPVIYHCATTARSVTKRNEVFINFDTVPSTCFCKESVYWKFLIACLVNWYWWVSTKVKTYRYNNSNVERWNNRQYFNTSNFLSTCNNYVQDFLPWVLFCAVCHTQSFYSEQNFV